VWLRIRWCIRFMFFLWFGVCVLCIWIYWIMYSYHCVLWSSLLFFCGVFCFGRLNE
jgi:hypothetical protein